MIRIINDHRELECYKKIAELKGSYVKQLVLDEEIFEKAVMLFDRGFVLLKIIGGRGQNRKEIYIVNRRDKIIDCSGNYIDADINAHVCNLDKSDTMDVSLLEKFNVFVFEELDEYTYKIARLLINRYGQKRIYFKDSNAAYFFERNKVTVISDLAHITEKKVNRILYISSSKTTSLKMAGLEYCTYSSIQVMSSLCWACQVRHPGKRRGTVLLINTKFDEGCGLGFIIRAVSVLRTLAQERGWMSVVHISGNMYTDESNQNMWNQYFDQDEEYEAKILSESENVIDLAENHFSQLAIYYNPYFMEVWHKVEEHVKPQLKPLILKDFENNLYKPLRETQSRVLGVLIRGTDASKEASELSAIYCMIRQCIEEMHIGKFDYIFLATEDKNIFDLFNRMFKDKLLYVDQKRVCAGVESNKLIGKLLAIESGKKEQFGKDYLYITYCLSKCNALLYNMASGGYYLSKMWLNGIYEFEKQLKYTLPEIEKLYVVCEMLQHNKKGAIYGTGIVCSRILKFLGKSGEPIEYCDTKAEEAIYEYHGKEVMRPKELITRYKKGLIQFIIIASLIYADEIEKFLVNHGVLIQDIIIFRDSEGILMD